MQDNNIDLKCFDAYFNIQEFASLGLFKEVGLLGIFDRQYVEYADIAGNHPTFLCPSDQVADIELGDEITINQKSYTIAAIQPDGTGLTLLVLHEA